MILHEIELRSVGPFREQVRLGPFSRGLNIIAAPNEAGKTTAMRAAARALFDKHTTKGGELESLRPVGTELSPRIAVDFETAQGRFLIAKTFLQSPTSVLKQRHGEDWETIAEGDAADRKIREVLDSSLPGKGGTKPEHWGFLGFLWARQGEVTAWPTLDDEAVGQKIRARLVRVELDPVIERLRERLFGISDEIITSTGRPKANGAMDSAEKELEAIDAALAGIQQTRTEIESTQQRYQQAVATVAQLEREQGEREESAQKLREQAAAAERLKGELESRQKEFASVQEKLLAVSKDAETQAARQKALATERTSFAASEESVKGAETQLAAIREKIDARQASRPEQEKKLAALRENYQRVGSLLKLRQVEAQVTTLSRQQTLAKESAASVAELNRKLSRLPALTPAKLTQLQELSDAVTALRARVNALGLTAELTPESDSKVRVEADGKVADESLTKGKPARFRSPQSLTLALEGWGRVVIRSGAEEGRDAAGELSLAEQRFRKALEEAEVVSLEAAREAVSARKTLEVEVKAAQATHKERLGTHPSLEALDEAIAAATRRMESLVESVKPTAEEKAQDSSALETEEARLGTAIPSEEKQLAEIDKALAGHRSEERAAVENVQTSAAAANKHRTEVRTLETQISELSTRYPTGIDAAKAEAGNQFVQAEARLNTTKSQLPPDFEQLPERNRRAAVALQELLNSLQTARRDRDSALGALESLGGQGIYSRETELEEKKAEILLRRDAARTRGWTARIAHDLIGNRKQAATRAVLFPLEDRLSAAFASLTGNADRRVFLDESLQVVGIGRSRDAVHSFEGLSQGAREQLLLCLRIAVAQELATESPQTLILDDVLVNTDSVRQERVLDLLGTLAADLQILILTCHPDRYRGIGVGIEIGSPRNTAL